jgi:hypothetical protein
MVTDGQRGQTDMTKLTVAFRNFVNSPKNGSQTTTHSDRETRYTREDSEI